MLLRSHSFLLGVLLMLALGACGDDADAPSDKLDAGSEPSVDGGRDASLDEARFVLTVTQWVDDVASSYLLVLDSIEAGEIDLDQAREFAGGITTVVRDGYVFVAEDDAPVVSRYRVSDAGELIDQERVSFADYGVSSAAYGINFFASPTRSYVTIDTATRLIWDPSSMEIGDTMKLDLPDPAEGFELNASYDRGLLVRGKQVFQSLYTANWDEYSFAPQSHIAIWNSESDEVSAISTSSCPMLDAATQDDEGNVYYSNWVHVIGARYIDPDKAPKPCAVRIPAGESEIDEAWTRDLSEYVDGRPVMNLQYAGDGKFIASVFHEEHAQKPIDEAQVSEANWRLWSFDLEARTAVQVNGVDWNDGGYSAYRIDGHTYVLITTDDAALSYGYEITGSNARELFRVSGAGYQLGKL